MAELNFMPMFWDTFFADTEHMPEEAAKAHLFLLGHAWLRGAKLPDDDRVLARLCRIGPKKWVAIKSCVLALWQKSEDGLWTQKRLLKEFDSVRRRIEVNRKNGLAGGRPKSDKKTNDFNKTDKANGFYGETQTKPSISIPIEVSKDPTDPLDCSKEQSCTNSEKEARRVNRYPEEFQAFWKAYPTDAGMAKKEAFTAWKRLAPEDRSDAIASIPTWKAHCATIRDYRMLHACRYLSQRRFEGLIQTAERVSAQVFIKIGSPQWRAWAQSLGKQPPVNKEGSGWWFKSEWPPNYERIGEVA